MSGLREDDPVDSFTWDTTGVPSGTYYVYAIINDGKNAPTINYSTGRVTVLNPNAPERPNALASAGGPEMGQVTLSWASLGDGIDHYDVLLTDDAAGDGYSVTQSAGSETSIFLSDLVSGQRYRASVVAVAADGHRSLPAQPVLIS